MTPLTASGPTLQACQDQIAPRPAHRVLEDADDLGGELAALGPLEHGDPGASHAGEHLVNLHRQGCGWQDHQERTCQDESDKQRSAVAHEGVNTRDGLGELS